MVEFVVSGPGHSAVEELRRVLPMGEALWFLRWNGQAGVKEGARKPSARDLETYGVISLQGVIVSTPAGVRTPLWSQDDLAGQNMAAEARTFNELEAVIARVKA